MSMPGGIAAGDQILDGVLAVTRDGAAGGAGGRLADVFELPAEAGELLYGELGPELDGGGDLLLLFDVTFGLAGLGASLPFCCCLHFALLFLNHTCMTKNTSKLKKAKLRIT